MPITWLRLWPAVLTLVLSGGGPERQSGVPCYYDWGTATPQSTWVKPIVDEYQIVSACRRGRAETVRWDEIIREFQENFDLRIFPPDERAKIERFVEMLRKERDHLRASAVPRAGSSPAHPDSTDRSLTLDQLFAGAASSENRLLVEPRFRSWVPRYLQRAVAQKLDIPGRIVEARGPILIRRGDRVIRLEEAVTRSSNLILRPGDVFETGPAGRLVIELSGGKIELRENGTMAVPALDGQCMILEDGSHSNVFGSNKVMGVHLIEGTLLWLTTNEEVRGKCVISTVNHVVSVRGTEFAVTSLPLETGTRLGVNVKSGAIEVRDLSSGTRSTISAGGLRWFEHDSARIEWNVTNSCNQPVRFRLHEYGPQQPTSSWRLRDIPPGDAQQFAITGATIGKQVCYGANSNDGKLRWGVGVDGGGSCERCCWQTTAASHTREVNLTCR